MWPSACDALSLRRVPANKRLKLSARVDCGMNPSSARRSLSAIRYAAHSNSDEYLGVRG